MKRVPDSLIRAGMAARTALEAALQMQESYLAQLDEWIAAGESQEPAPEFPPVDGCTHPIEKRQDTSTPGHPHSFFCRGCRRTSEELAELKGKG